MCGTDTQDGLRGPLCPAEAEFKAWLMSVPDPPWRARMGAPLRDLDERVRAKEDAIAAIRRRKNRERYRAKKAGITPAMQQKLFGHLSPKPPTD